MTNIGYEMLLIYCSRLLLLFGVNGFTNWIWVIVMEWYKCLGYFEVMIVYDATCMLILTYDSLHMILWVSLSKKMNEVICSSWVFYMLSLCFEKQKKNMCSFLSLVAIFCLGTAGDGSVGI